MNYENGHRWWKRRLVVCFCAGLLVVIALAIGLGVGLTRDKDDDTDDISEGKVDPPTIPKTPGSFWTPNLTTNFQIQLKGEVDPASAASGESAFILDLFDTPIPTIQTLHSQLKRVICYFSAGSYENWRPDAKQFAKSDYGKGLDGWPGEWWVDTRSANVREIMKTRITIARQKGCDGVDPDNTDAYDNDNGLGLTQADAVDYITFLSSTAHELGLACGLKNNGAVVRKVVDKVEWVVNEQCQIYEECKQFEPFIGAKKPVFEIEYRDDPSRKGGYTAQTERDICNKGGMFGFATVVKDLDLQSWGVVCPLLTPNENLWHSSR